MNIKWAYYLIAVIYVILIVLKGINYLNQKQYEKDNADILKAFTIKRDFFTTVSIICIIVTVAINMAAIIGGKHLNTSSMIITCLVLGFTVINSFSYMRFTSEGKDIYFLGYTLVEGDISNVKSKVRKNSNVLNINFTRDIDSYNYVKVTVYGKHKDDITKILETLKAEETEESK